MQGQINQAALFAYEGEMVLCRFMSINVWTVGIWTRELAVSMTRRLFALNAVA
jgi:hypothetical protein